MFHQSELFGLTSWEGLWKNNQRWSRKLLETQSLEVLYSTIKKSRLVRFCSKECFWFLRAEYLEKQMLFITECCSVTWWIKAGSKRWMLFLDTLAMVPMRSNCRNLKLGKPLRHCLAWSFPLTDEENEFLKRCLDI